MSAPAHPSTLARLQRFTGRLDELAVDALLISGEANRRYLSGFTGSAGALLISRDRYVLITDFRYTQQASLQADDFEVVESMEPLDAIAELLRELSVARLGFEANHTSYAAFERLRDRSGELPDPPKLVPLDGVVETQRRVKDARELESIREAVRIADEVMAIADEAVRPGITERDLANRLEAEMKTRGAEEASFPTIVAAGPNAAMAHHRPGPHEIGAGEPVIVDLGVKVDGYCSDITRTFHTGAQDGRFRAIYATVLAAQRAAEAGIRAGLRGQAADALARDPIVAAGYGDNFGHGTGHGVGLEIHEGPRLSRRSNDVLEAGMVTSVEPGIYLANWGGVRIEDLVLVRPVDAEVLTRAPK